MRSSRPATHTLRPIGDSLLLAAQELYLDGEAMLDPLSLSDFPSITPSRDCFVRVAGVLPEAAGKK